VTPEAAAGGPIALVREGDRIALDLHARTLDILVDPLELERRRREWRPLEKPLHGVLARYAETVGQADRGAVLRKPRGSRERGTTPE